MQAPLTHATQCSLANTLTQLYTIDLDTCSLSARFNMLRNNIESHANHADERIP